MEYINAITFYITALIIITTSFFIIFTKKMMHAIFFALICFLGFGLLFFSLNAPFNGVVQISIYGIALSILFSIAIMITDYKQEEKQKIKLSPRFFLAFFGILMIVISLITFLTETIKYDKALETYINSSHILIPIDNTKQLSVELLTHNTFSFEILGIYMLIVLIGISLFLKFNKEVE